MTNGEHSRLSYSALVKESRHIDAARLTQRLRVAVLSDAAVPQIVPLLEALFAREGIAVDVYLAEIGAIELEAFDPGSGLYAFEPEVVVLLHSLNALRLNYYRADGARLTLAQDFVAQTVRVWEALRSHCAAVILQSNFPLPYERPFGNYEHKVTHTLHAAVRELNAALAQAVRERPQVLMNDVEAIASWVGRKSWFDERLWAYAKAFCSLEHLPLVAQNIVRIAAAHRGRVVKCVVADLDNTLWGGVVGDDGVEGIQLGPFGDGEPYYLLQHYLLELKRRGIVLAVCSKNEQETALRPFRKHPDMVLRPDDFAVFVANWQPKPDNISYIRDCLNIGLDSIVFLDDNPFERDLVRRTLPEVIVPELPEDPAEYVQALSELNLFEATSYSEEDRRRAELYRDNAVRRAHQAAFTNLDEYLRSLEMRVTMRRFDAMHLGRIAQLIQRSNQFNLTTRRYTLAECEVLMNDSAACIPLYLKLSDRFGDNGLVSVIILRPVAEVMEIDSWLMSCRVLGRGVEQYAMNEVVELARRRRCERVRGRYIPTAKNAMVKEFFAQFCFAKTAEGEDGSTVWELSVERYQPRPTHMARDGE